MTKISVKQQGIKGGNPTYKNDVGYNAVFIEKDGNRIVCDAFEGYGNTYKRRNVALIEVYKNDKLLFSGNFDELTDILQGK